MSYTNGGNGSLNGKVNGHGVHPANGSPDEQAEAPPQAIVAAVEAAIEAERQRRLVALGGKQRIYPKPLLAGPQTYVDPTIWSGHKRDDYRAVLGLMSQLDGESTDEP